MPKKTGSPWFNPGRHLLGGSSASCGLLEVVAQLCEHQLSRRLYKRYPSDMIDENGRSVSNPLAVFTTQSLEEELRAVADNKSSRESFAEMFPTAKSAMGPCNNATLLGF